MCYTSVSFFYNAFKSSGHDYENIALAFMQKKNTNGPQKLNSNEQRISVLKSVRAAKIQPEKKRSLFCT